MSESLVDQVAPTDSYAPEMSRRGFLKGLATAGIVAATAGISATVLEAANADQAAAEDAGAEPVKSEMLVVASEAEAVKAEPTVAHDGYLATGVETLGVVGLKVLVTLPAERLGLKTGNAGRQSPEDFRDASPLAKKMNEMRIARMSPGEFMDTNHLMKSVTKVPVEEELVYRLLPSLVANALGIRGDAWPVGAATTALFARDHSYNPHNGLKTVPIPQALGGAWYWWLQRNRGVTHAITAHSVNNASAAALKMGSYARLRAKYR